MHEYDFIVVGSGAAGLTAALKAARHGRVALLTKKSASDSNSAWAQGGIACVQSGEDSFDQHVQDTLVAGAGLCKEDAVRTIVSEGPARIAELVNLGVAFDKREVNGHAEFDLTREGGHTKRRVLHHLDATGKEVSDKLLAATRAEKNIELMENHYAIDLITTGKLGFVSEDRVLGLHALNESSGEVLTLRSDRVLLATGGCGRVYQYTTNPKVATGDGVAMAWRAGATVANMEFVQFHPTCLYHPKQRSFLITEAIRGEGGVLIGKDGKEFMQRYDIPAWQSGDAQSLDELVVIYHNWDEIRRLMWDYVSIVRTSKRLQRAAARLRNLKREVQEFYWSFRVTSEVLELRNLVETASLIVDCALRRHESRGLHYTMDYPGTSGFAEDTVLRRF